MLNAKTVENARPGEKTRRLFDGLGLYLEVSPAGGRWWRFKYTLAGKEKRLSLGVYPEIGLKAARDARDDMRALLRRGIDPAIQRKAQRRSLAQPDDVATLETVAREWHGVRAPGWSPKHAERILNRLEAHVFPFLGGRPVRELRPAELLLCVQRIAKRGTIETAHRSRADLAQVFQYALATERVETDPTLALRGRNALPPSRSKGFAAMTSPKDVGQLLAAIDGYTGEPQVRAALRLLALTFVRPGELRHARWDEFDFDGEVWRIPAGRMKMKREHLVPLSKQSIAILEELRPLTGKRKMLDDANAEPLVFPSLRSRGRPISDMTLNAAMRRLGIGADEHTAHGFRSTASTLLNELGWGRDAIERQLSHSDPDKVRAAYHRAEHLAERRKMMQAWADYLDKLRARAAHPNAWKR